MIEPKRLMKVVDVREHYTIYVHDETKVMYFVPNDVHGRVAVCVMVGADGKPCIYEGERK